MAAADQPAVGEAAAVWAGLTWSAAVAATLDRFARWLVEEAIPAGGLGPGEEPRIWRRHIADSLLFAAGWRQRHDPETLIDVGSGVGLPGIPLAIAWPATAVTLLDRSGRRSELARRAVRVLGLDNVTVVTADARRYRRRAQLVTVRAALPVTDAVALGGRLAVADGVVVIGLSPHPDRNDRGTPDGEVIEVPDSVLDSPVRLLRMTPHGV